MSSQQILPAGFAYCGRSACSSKSTPFAVQEMKLIKYRDNERRLVCSACYSHYMERLALQQTGSEQARVRPVNPLFLPTESVNVDPTLENPAAVHGEDHRKRVHEEVSRGYRGKDQESVMVMPLPFDQTRRTDRTVPGIPTAVGAGRPAGQAEWISALAAVFQQAANGTGTPGPPRIEIPTATSINPPRPPVQRNTAPGYTAQHTFFQYESARQQGMAYARSVVHKGNVKGILCYHPDGKVKCQTIGWETILVDIHISHAELKAELLTALGPIWTRKYPGTILCLEHLTLRSETGARLLEAANNTGRDIISRHFAGTKGARGSKKVLVIHVEVDRAIVFVAEEQLEEQDLAAQQYHELGGRTKVKTKTYTTRKRFKTSTSRVRKRPATGSKRYEHVSSEDSQECESEDQSEDEQQDWAKESGISPTGSVAHKNPNARAYKVEGNAYSKKRKYKEVAGDESKDIDWEGYIEDSDKDAGKLAAGLMVAPKGKSSVEQEVQIIGERKNPSVKVSVKVPKASPGATHIRRNLKTIAGPSELRRKTDFHILDQARIGEALIAQKPFDDRDGNIGSERKHNLEVRLLDFQKFADLVARGGDACRFTDDSPLKVLVIVDMKTMEKGSFKVAYTAFTNYILPDFKSSMVCVKQAFEDDGHHTAPLPRPRKVKLPDYEKLVSLLKTELKTLAWASALLDDVYAFIENKKPKAEFYIPRFRFVKAALGEDRKVQENVKRHAYLIEEYIDPVNEGPFVKYINNGVAKPLGATTRVSDNYRRNAEFLCFTQHVQYVISGKIAYVSDYQGGKSLLTDPQVMTSSKFGKVFGDGNVGSFFDNFEKQHNCNENIFCKYFDIAGIYDAASFV